MTLQFLQKQALALPISDRWHPVQSLLTYRLLCVAASLTMPLHKFLLYLMRLKSAVKRG